MTFESILQRMLDKVTSDVDKREGSIIYDALAPAALELAKMYAHLQYLNLVTFADEATDQYLEKRCAERGVIRKSATKAIRKGIFNIDVSIGTRFELADTTYRVIDQIKSLEYRLECEQAGLIGNRYTGNLSPMSNIHGLENAQLTDIIIPGKEIEDDESLRQRYFESLDGEAFGGNIADYIQKTKSIDGVGAVKVYPVWAGKGTVKISILDSSYNKPSVELVNVVQETMDPLILQGKGKGLAPINHIVTVASASETVVNISSNITLQDQYVWEDILPLVQETINSYFAELRKSWSDSENIVVRVTWIESRILTLDGVLDIQDTVLNGSTGNLLLDKDNIPTLGTVTKL